MSAAAPPQRSDQLDLFGDYKANVAAYPRFHEYFRTHRTPSLAVWGRNDPLFLPAGAEAFRRDIPDGRRGLTCRVGGAAKGCPDEGQNWAPTEQATTCIYTWAVGDTHD